MQTAAFREALKDWARSHRQAIISVIVLLVLGFAAGAVLAHDKPKPPPEPQLLGMPPDNHGGRTSHIGYSAAIGAIGTALAPEHKWWVLAGCMAIGVAKELHDRAKGQPGYRHGLFSRNDLRYDAAGCIAGVGGVTLYRKAF